MPKFVVVLFLIVIAIIISIPILMTIVSKYPQKNKISQNSSEIKYLALGDSYTIGEGISKNDSYPQILVDRLNQKGVNLKLAANPSKTGFTTQDLIDRELPVFDSSNPDLVTILIGVNDWVGGSDKFQFQKNLKIILDHVSGKLPSKKIILITIPDFGKTPNGKRMIDDRDITKGITEFNDIIKDEGKTRNIKVVDIFDLSQKMEFDSSLVAGDRLHPSKKEYEEWVNLLYPVVQFAL